MGIWAFGLLSLFLFPWPTAFAHLWCHQNSNHALSLPYELCLLKFSILRLLTTQAPHLVLPRPPRRQLQYLESFSITLDTVDRIYPSNLGIRTSPRLIGINPKCLTSAAAVRNSVQRILCATIYIDAEAHGSGPLLQVHTDRVPPVSADPARESRFTSPEISLGECDGEEGEAHVKCLRCRCRCSERRCNCSHSRCRRRKGSVKKVVAEASSVSAGRVALKSIPAEVWRGALERVSC